MPLHLRITEPKGPPLELDGVLPERLRSSPQPGIENWPIWRGNRRVGLGECFAISGDPSDGTLTIEGDLSAVHAIGQEMSQGEIHVKGNVGHRLGLGMSGGRIKVQGNAGDGLGVALSGGLITLDGDAGDQVAGARPGAKRGMTGGVITIRGSVGELAGLKMRGGILAIAGDVGRGLGHAMLAGSIVVMGRSGDRVGVEMRRGTILLLGPSGPPLPLTFRPAGSFRPVFARLLARELESLGFPIDPRILSVDLMLHHGDMLALGKGEIYTRLPFLRDQDEANSRAC